jgi:transcriptional regulator with XRE-family HTH domain
MASFIPSIRHPYWGFLGVKAHERRTQLGLSQAKVALQVGLSVREYAALESGFIPPDVAEALGRLELLQLDYVLDWDEGTARETVDQSIKVMSAPTWSPSTEGFTPDRSEYSQAAWTRLGKAIQTSRLALKMTRNVFAYAIKSTSKTVMRLEEGRVYGDPRTAPPGDYNSEKYMLKRLALIEMALEWDAGQARTVLDGAPVSRAA